MDRRGGGSYEQKFFGSFFQKRTAFLLFLGRGWGLDAGGGS
jgi:hypothetical protein